MARRNAIDQFEDSTIYTTTDSASGSNAFYHLCEVMGQKCSYASCLKKVADRAHGRLETSFATCSAEIGKGTCPALAMKDQEKKAGKALFYVNREKYRTFYFAQDQDIVLTPSKMPPKKAWGVKPTVPPITVTPVVPAFESNDYAAAINSALNRKQSPVTVQSKPVAPIMNTQTPVQLAGLSMMEIARARMGQKVGQQ